MGNEFDDEDGSQEDGSHERSTDERSSAAAGAARRQFMISGTITVAGQSLGARSANDNGASVPEVGEKT